VLLENSSSFVADNGAAESSNVQSLLGDVVVVVVIVVTMGPHKPSSISSGRRVPALLRDRRSDGICRRNDNDNDNSSTDDSTDVSVPNGRTQMAKVLVGSSNVSDPRSNIQQ